MRFAAAGVISGLEFLGQMLGWAKERLAVEHLLSERERWLLWSPVALAFGVAGYFLLPMEPPLWAGPGWAGLFFGLAFFSRRHTWLALVFLALAIAGCGLAAGQVRTMSVAAPVLKKKIGPVEVHGRLIEAGIGVGQQRYVLDNLSIRGVTAAETPLRARITVHVPTRSLPDGAPPHPAPGDYVRLTASRRCSRRLSRLRLAHGILAGNPGFKELVRSGFPTARRSLSRMQVGRRVAAYLFGCVAYGIGYQRASSPFWEIAAAGSRPPC